MRYELFLRRDEGLTAEEAASAAAQATAADLHVDVYEREGQPLGLDLGIGLDEAPRSAETLCDLTFELASTHGLSVFDPQLGRVVVASERDLVCERFAASAGSLTGFVSAPRPAPRPVGTRVWLVLVGLLVLAILAARALTCAAG